MQTVDIVYFYEHAARELDVACAVTAGLRQRGLRVEILHWPTGFPGAVTRLRPRLIALPFCYSEQSYEALLAYWREAMFFNLTWEQLFYAGNRSAKTPRGEFALRHVIHHAWSKEYAMFLQTEGIPTQSIFLNGQPAYALYDEPYRHYFASRADLAARYDLDLTRRWVFFPENYNWAFYSQATLEQFIAKGQSPEDVRSMREFCISSLKVVLKWCARAAREENIELILRPRPSTPRAEFEAFARQVLRDIPSHFHILQAESVREWILASDVVISSHSTSLIEAALAGKKVYILEPLPIPAALHVEWHDLVTRIRTDKDFLKICEGADLGDEQSLAEWARKTFMSQGDAIHRLVDYLADLALGKIEAPPPASRQAAVPSLRWIPPAWLWSLYRRGKQFFRFPGTHGIEPEFVKDFFPRHDVETRISQWANVIKMSER
ncbi:MAG: hypothetical protein ABWK53_00260 [Anaerolineales bacterium]